MHYGLQIILIGLLQSPNIFPPKAIAPEVGINNPAIHITPQSKPTKPGGIGNESSPIPGDNEVYFPGSPDEGLGPVRCIGAIDEAGNTDYECEEVPVE